MSAKGAKVQRRTFDKWAVSGVLGHKTVIESGLEYVYFVWCKVCAPQSGNKPYLYSNKKNYRKEITSIDLFLYLHVF